MPELQPLGDRVLVKVEDAADVTLGGVVLPDSAKERPLRCATSARTPAFCVRAHGGRMAGGSTQQRHPTQINTQPATRNNAQNATTNNKHNSGTVVRAGPGRYDKDAEGGRSKPAVAPGDRVLYFKYAGDSMETPKGEKFVVLREDDILCKA